LSTELSGTDNHRTDLDGGQGRTGHLPMAGRSLGTGLSTLLRIAVLVGVVGLCGANPPTTDGEAARVGAVIGLDHIPIAVGDLESSAEEHRELGFTLKPGRPHANGIRNQHVKFQDGTELELITTPEVRDGLTATYRRHLQAGDGPAFLALWPGCWRRSPTHGAIWSITTAPTLIRNPLSLNLLSLSYPSPRRPSSRRRSVSPRRSRCGSTSTGAGRKTLSPLPRVPADFLALGGRIVRCKRPSSLSSLPFVVTLTAPPGRA